MNIGQQILFLISTLGALNGILLSAYIFLRRKQRTLPAIFLSIMLMAISLRVGNSVFLYFNTDLPKIVMQIGWSACFLIGPSIYFFFRTALNKPNSTLSKNEKILWVVIIGIIVIGGILKPYSADPDLWCNAISYFIYVQWASFLIATGFLLRPVLHHLFFQKTALSTTEKFWLIMFGGNSTIFLAYQTSMTGIFQGLCLAGAVAFSVILCLTVFYYLYGVEMNDILQLEEVTPPAKTNKRQIAEPEAIAWIEKLQKAIAEKDLYKDPNLKLGDLAQKINISGHQLSQLLNNHLGKNFSTYINEYRINEACKLILEDGRLSIEAIGYEVGYNSKSTFYTAFKKIKDMTPALFKESMEKAGAS